MRLFDLDTAANVLQLSDVSDIHEDWSHAVPIELVDAGVVPAILMPVMFVLLCIFDVNI